MLVELPKLSLVSGSGALQRTLERLPAFHLERLLCSTPAAAMRAPPIAASSSAHGRAGAPPLTQPPSGGRSQLWRAYLLLPALSHAYLWCDGPDTPPRLPAFLALPWTSVAAALSMPPVSVYATYNLLNWWRLDPQGPIALGNINYNGGMGEEWFRLVHVSIEAAAAPALAALAPMQAAAAQGDEEGVAQGLAHITASLTDMQALLDRMGEKCDPYVYYKRVRQPMAGWKNNPALPQGLIYEGVSPQPLQLYGETGAQSSIVPAFDAALGVTHEDGWLREYLGAMRAHMPPAHRTFLAALEAAPSARTAAARGGPRLRAAYDAALHELQRFRAQHRGFAASYIAQWSAKERGTGGSDFMPALSAYKHTTRAHKLEG